MKNVIFAILALLCFFACNQKINAPVITKYDSLLRVGGNIDTARKYYAYETAKKLTNKYGYDIYGRSTTATTKIGESFVTVPVVDFFCDWFTKDNVKVINAEISADSKRLGFYSIAFFNNPKTEGRVSHYAVGVFDSSSFPVK